MNAHDENARETSKNRETFRKLMDVQHIMMALRHRKMHKGGPLADATRGRGRILALLQLKDGIATKDMAQILGIRVSSLNETLAKLEKEGFVERTADENDKRVLLVTLTEKGRAAKPENTHMPDRLFKDFSDDELSQLAGYLDRMIANLEPELGEDAQEFLQKMRDKRHEFMEGHGHKGHRGACRGHDKHSEYPMP